MQYIIGFNPGYGWTKTAFGNQSVCFQSVLAPATDVQFHNDLGNNGAAFEITTDQQSWFVGESAYLHSKTPIAPRSSDRGAWIVRTLLMASLERLGIHKGDVSLVTGLPVQWYTRHKERIIDELTGQMRYAINRQERAINVRDVLVVPESYGTLYRALLDENGNLIDKGNIRQRNVGIIDVGTYTTNCVLAKALHYAEDDSRSQPIGMARVYELLQKRVAKEHRDITFQEAEYAVTEDPEILVRGETVNLSYMIESVKSQVAQAITGMAKTIWGTGDDMIILITGGGGIALSTQIRIAFPHAHTITDPQMANAIGFHRYAVRRFVNK